MRQTPFSFFFAGALSGDAAGAWLHRCHPLSLTDRLCSLPFPIYGYTLGHSFPSSFSFLGMVLVAAGPSIPGLYVDERSFFLSSPLLEIENRWVIAGPSFFLSSSSSHHLVRCSGARSLCRAWPARFRTRRTPAAGSFFSSIPIRRQQIQRKRISFISSSRESHNPERSGDWDDGSLGRHGVYFPPFFFLRSAIVAVAARKLDPSFFLSLSSLLAGSERILRGSKGSSSSACVPFAPGTWGMPVTLSFFSSSPRSE